MCAENKIKTVLVVDDQLEMRIFLRTLLETHGFKPVLAADGRHGLECARQHRPNVIMLDVMMPFEGGAIMYRNLKADAKLKHIPVIMLSAVSPKAFKHYLHMLNAQSDQDLPVPNAYIEKPPAPEQVLKTLRACCQAAKA